MDSALFGFLGAIAGALAAIIAAFLTFRSQIKLNQDNWRRDHREEAYNNTINSLLSAQFKRSTIQANGLTAMGQDVIKEWFDDLTKCQMGLSILTIYCSKQTHERVEIALSEMRLAIITFLGLPNEFNMPVAKSNKVNHPVDLLKTLDSVYKTILECAREDLGREIR